MQVGRSNPLSFIAGSAPALAGQGEAAGAEVDGPAQSAAKPSGVEDTDKRAATGVILSLRTEQTRAADAYGKTLVYADSRKPAAKQQGEEGPEGVLLAMPASAVEIKSQAFMQHAVAAMRAYADEQERSKAFGTATAGSSAASLIPHSLADVQRLATRLRLFG